MKTARLRLWPILLLTTIGLVSVDADAFKNLPLQRLTELKDGAVVGRPMRILGRPLVWGLAHFGVRALVGVTKTIEVQAAGSLKDLNAAREAALRTVMQVPHDIEVTRRSYRLFGILPLGPVFVADERRVYVDPSQPISSLAHELGHAQKGERAWGTHLLFRSGMKANLDDNLRLFKLVGLPDRWAKRAVLLTPLLMVPHLWEEARASRAGLVGMEEAGFNTRLARTNHRLSWLTYALSAAQTTVYVARWYHKQSQSD